MHIQLWYIIVKYVAVSNLLFMTNSKLTVTTLNMPFKKIAHAIGINTHGSILIGSQFIENLNSYLISTTSEVMYEAVSNIYYDIYITIYYQFWFLRDFEV